MGKNNIVGGAGITAGENVHISNVSGQFAIGENIVQIINKDGSKSWLYTNGIRPTIDPANTFGRQQELEEIDKRFKQSTALAITGFGGTGKSTLASIYLDRIEKKGEYAGIYWRKVDESIDISDLVGSFFTAIGKLIQEVGRYKPIDLLNLFFRELNAAPYFLVLDNFEIILDPQTNIPLKEKTGFSDLIENACQNAGRSRFLFTSWECPASERGITPEFYCIGGLDEQAALQLLRRKGLTEPEDNLKKAIELSGGHPLALILLTQLIKSGKKLPSILKDNTLWIGEKGKVAVKILDKFYKERLSEEERKLLQYVSLYRNPVPSEAIVTAANSSEWTKDVVENIALNLIMKSLLQITEESYWEESLIQSYAYNKLTDRVERHKLACQYYLSLPLPEVHTKKEDVQSLIEAYYHACMAKEYDRAATIIFDYKLHEDLDRWGNYRALIDIYQRILPKDPLYDTPLLSNIRIHSRVIGNLGRAYSILGEINKAIEYYENAQKIAKEIGDKINESTLLGWLGNAYRTLGNVRKGIEYFEKALNISQEIGDRKGESIKLGDLGFAYYTLGDVKKAIEYFEKALSIAYETGNKEGESTNLADIGLAYHTLGDVRKAIGHYEKALKIAQEIEDRRGEGVWLGRLGLAYHDLGDVKKAIEYFEKALKIAQEIGDRRNEGTWFGNLGNAYSTLGDMKRATEYNGKALKIAQEIRDRINEEIWLGSLGNAFFNLGNARKAAEYYEKALMIAYEIEDRNGEGIWLNNLGVAFDNEDKYKEALACYLLAKDIRSRIGDPQVETTELKLTELKEKLGEKEFEKLASEVVPRVDDIIKKILEEVQNKL